MSKKIKYIHAYRQTDRQMVNKFKCKCFLTFGTFFSKYNFLREEVATFLQLSTQLSERVQTRRPNFTDSTKEEIINATISVILKGAIQFCSGQLPPRQLPARIIYPWTICLGQFPPRIIVPLGQLPPDNYAPENCHLGQFPPGQFPLYNSHLMQISPRKFPPENCTRTIFFYDN